MWRNITSDDGTMINVVPIQDDTEHHVGADCICGPNIESIGGGALLLVRHHSLDGREVAEPEGDGEGGVVALTASITVHPDDGYHFWVDGDETMSVPTQIGMLIALYDKINDMVQDLRATNRE